MATQTSKRRKFVADGVFYAELIEILTRELAEDGYCGVEVRVTPMRIEIIIRATRTKKFLGEKGRRMTSLDEKNPKRIFEGEALLRKMNCYGLLDESQNKLDYVLALTIENFLERHLQTIVFKSGMAKSIHHSHVLIRQRHIRVGKQLVNISSFMVT